MSTITKAGRYELREELGRGAMGVVYHAHDPVIGRDVAVKTMHLSAEGTGMTREELVGRFQTEARAAGLLTHPNIVVIYDAGEEEGIFYITMEMVDGRSLQTMLDGRQLFPLPRVMKLMEQVCAALDFAHHHNVVHRDIKPANLMLTGDDTVKITDFGTAKILQFGTAQTAHVMGTPSYMSPEQVKGKPVDGRSDIFSLGVILYELMTGEKPFPGQNITTVIYKIINEEPIPPRSLDSSIHPGLSAVITRALAKDPSVRFQTCHEFLDALKNYREMVTPEATIRVAPPVTQPAAGSNRPAPPQSLAPDTFSTARARDAEKPLQVVSPAILQAEKTSQRRGSLLLSLVLLGIIAYAGYRIWPPMVDLWQRARETEEKQVVPVKAAPIAADVAPDVPDVKADTKPDTPPQIAPPGQKTAPPAAKAAQARPVTPVASQQPPAAAPEQTGAPTPPASPLTSGAVQVSNAVEKPAVTPKPEASLPTPATNAVETRLLSELARLSLADRVKVQAGANTLTLSGRVTPSEHLMLLNRLHWVPAKVRIVDDLEYSGDLGQAAVASSVGWVWVRSEPEGAEISLDGTNTGLRTPARVEMSQGDHEVQLNLKGFPASQRSVVVRQGQTIQITQPLGEQ